MQTLMHRFKYKGNSDLGKQLGVLMGMQLKQSNRFDDLMCWCLCRCLKIRKDNVVIISQLFCVKELLKAMQLPIIEDAVIRPMHTDTQTKKAGLNAGKYGRKISAC